MNRTASIAGCIAIGLLTLTDCTRYQVPAEFLSRRGIEQPAETRFMICHGFACTFHTEVSFGAADWLQVAAPFDHPATTAAEERGQIGQAVALFEQIVGRKTGTETDTGGLTYIAAGNPTQLDCIDETTNTTTYLTLLQAHGLLHFYRPAPPASRGFFLDGRWYHETAVMMELPSGAEFAVDSWVEDNGKPPLIVPLEEWQWSWSGWDS